MGGRPTIAIGLTGSIAAYKAIALVSLINTRADTIVVTTGNAERFVGRCTFQESTQVISESRETSLSYSPAAFTEQVDIVLVAPATANFIAKVLLGNADDLLSGLALAIRPDSKPFILAPAMNPMMYAHPVVRQNLAQLRNRGYTIVEPQPGRSACNTEGTGRLASVRTIADTVFKALDLCG